MKTIFTLFLSLSVSLCLAQNAMFVHTATAGTIVTDASYIDHPDLNGNPDAKLLVSHNWNPSNGAGVYNNNNTGLFYEGIQGQWMVYNEDGSNMIEDSSYNVYVAQGDEVYVHIADLANQGTSDSYSVLNHPDLNNNPNASIILSTYYNPNSLRNDLKYGVWYNGTRWIIYSEDNTAITLDTAFFVGVGGGSGVSAKHVADAGNVSGNWTAIDHPLLNGNPDAVFTFTHNWGASGDPSNILLDKVLGAWYTGTNWAIYTEDSSAMPQNAEFNLFIYDPTLGTTDNTLQNVTAYPNPVSTQLTVETTNEISQVEIYNILGQQVLTIEGVSNTMNIDVSNLPSGTYLAKVVSGNASKTIKLIKV